MEDAIDAEIDWIDNVGFNEREIRIGFPFVDVPMAAGRQVVKDSDPVSSSHETTDKMRTNEPGATSDEIVQ
jgi:hypothetical protein